MNKICWYYDRTSRNWVVQVLDNNNHEIESKYCSNKNDIELVIEYIEYFRKKYHTIDFAKYKYGE